MDLILLPTWLVPTVVATRPMGTSLLMQEVLTVDLLLVSFEEDHHPITVIHRQAIRMLAPVAAMTEAMDKQTQSNSNRVEEDTYHQSLPRTTTNLQSRDRTNLILPA